VSSNQPKIPNIVRAFLVDLDGVLYMGKNPIPGVRECLQRVSELGYGYRFVSNSTRRCRSSVSERLQDLGYSVPTKHIYTPPLAAIEKMKRSGKERCFLLTAGDVHLDFEDADISICEEDVDYVVIGQNGKVSRRDCEKHRCEARYGAGVAGRSCRAPLKIMAQKLINYPSIASSNAGYFSWEYP
jgi:ribonucleotide monophosphatase NagD (HAD superfamily)